MDLTTLPAGLPRPEDDGGARHLPGLAVPSLPLPATTGEPDDLAGLGPGRVVVYVYSFTGRPGEPLPPDWT